MGDYRCNICDETFKSGAAAVDHVDEEHDFYALAVSRIEVST